MILSILICTIPKRKLLFDRLLALLDKQKTDDVEIIFDDAEKEPIGYKRNKLLQSATGQYLCFIDDDDIVSNDYVEKILTGLESKPDCCSLNGIITINGMNPRQFIHSIDHKHYYEKDTIYYRPPNHLNVIRSSIAKQFRFPEISWGEDTDWAMQICRSGILKTEHKIEGIIYYYLYLQNK